jgi:citrate synthase
MAQFSTISTKPSGHDALANLDYLTRADALNLLGVKPQTLYAYVSRGWIHRFRDGVSGRSLYSRLDIERMKARSDARSGHAAVAAAAMRWGQPIMRSAITAITPDGPCYRGELATDFVGSNRSFESVAGLLLSGDSSFDPGAWQVDNSDSARINASLAAIIDESDDSIKFLAKIAMDLALEPDEWAQRKVAKYRAILINSIIYSLAPKRHDSMNIPGNLSISEKILYALGLKIDAKQAAALNAALVLCADHELAQTTFVARIAASAGADVGSCVGAAILSMPRHAARRSPAGAETVLNTLVSTNDLRGEVDLIQKSCAGIPGFNHPLYPLGDPRAKAMIDIAASLPNPGPKFERLHRLLGTIADEFHCFPSFETGLVAMAFALELPAKTATKLFVLARSAGWIAHIFEQWQLDAPLRPRAEYIGAAPRLQVS